MFTKEEAIQKLWDVGSHQIMAPEWADSIGEPFGIKFDEMTYTPKPTQPKGPMPIVKENGDVDWNPFTGVDVHSMATVIAREVGAERISLLGRGSQFRSDMHMIQQALGMEKEFK